MSIAAISRPSASTLERPAGSPAKPTSKSALGAKSSDAATAASLTSTSSTPRAGSDHATLGAGSIGAMKARGSTPSSSAPKPTETAPRKAGSTTPPDDDAKPTTLPRLGGAGKGGDKQSDTARATLDRVETYFRERFGRDGFNDRGGRVEVEVDGSAFGAHARVTRDPDATTASIVVGRLPVGDSGLERSVAGDVDIMAHEYAHLVVSSEIAGRATYDTVAGKNEHHAIQEGISDVFGAAIEQEWNLAGYRDHSADGNERADDDVEHARDVDPEDVDPHDWGALLVDGAVTLQEQAGWEALEQAFYDVLQDDRLTERTSMRQVAAWVVSAAHEHGGVDAARAVRATYAANGVLPMTPPRNVI